MYYGHHLDRIIALSHVHQMTLPLVPPASTLCMHVLNTYIIHTSCIALVVCTVKLYTAIRQVCCKDTSRMAG